MAKGPESRLQSRIMKFLKNYGGVWINVHGGMFQTSGVPDIIGCLDGRFYAFEIKTPDKFKRKDHNLSALQKGMLSDLREAGGRAASVCSVARVHTLIVLWRENE